MNNASPTWRILPGDVLDVLPTLPAGSVHCVVTSPPYWGLRDYGTARWEGGEPDCPHTRIVDTQRTPWANSAHGPHGQNRNGGASQKVKATGGVCARCGAHRRDDQLGLESVPDCLGWATGTRCGECYVCRIIDVFEEVRRILRTDGTLWLNIGDTYASDWPCQRRNQIGNGALPNGKREARPPRLGPGLKSKDLVGIPWRVVLALQSAGWWLRSEIVWSKAASMPESVTDRPTRAHEQIYLLTKSARYFYDAVAVAEPSVRAGDVQTFGGAKARNGQAQGGDPRNRHRTEQSSQWGKAIQVGSTRNQRDVWHLNPAPYPEAHFATFPPEIPRRAILAGTSAAGCCPTCGTPYRRITAKTSADRSSWNRSRFDDGKNAEVHPNVGRREDAHTDSLYPADSSAHRLSLLRQQARQNGHEYENRRAMADWTPGCACNAGAPVPCTVLDPFAGSGTTLAVALALGRSAIGIELNPAYITLAERRIAGVTPPLPNLETIIMEDAA